MKIKKTLYIQAVKWTFDSEFTIDVNSAELTTDNNCVYVTIAAHELNIDVPEFNDTKFALAEIEQLQKMRVEVLANNEVRLQTIDKKIADLQYIENKVEL